MMAGTRPSDRAQERIAFGGQDGFKVRGEGLPPVVFRHLDLLNLRSNTRDFNLLAINHDHARPPDLH